MFHFLSQQGCCKGSITKHNESQISLSPVTHEPQGKSTTGCDSFSGHTDILTFHIYLLGIKSLSSFVTSTGGSVSILSKFSTCFSRSIHREDLMLYPLSLIWRQIADICLQNWNHSFHVLLVPCGAVAWRTCWFRIKARKATWGGVDKDTMPVSRTSDPFPSK